MKKQIPSGVLITFSGIDGAGKSTIAHSAFDLLSNIYNVPGKYLWCKFGWHPLAKFKLSRFFSGERKNKQRIKKTTPILYQLYGRVLIQIHLMSIYWSVTRNLRRGFFVICDRYIYDSIIDLQQEFGYSQEHALVALKLSQLPQPKIAFYFDLQEDVAFLRKLDTISVDFLRERRRLYQSLFKEIEHIEIDASSQFEIVCSHVMEALIQSIDKGKNE